MRPVLWLRRRFVTGFFVAVPLIVSVAALIWAFDFIDGITRPLYDRWLGRHVPGLGLVTTALFLLLVGVAASNVLGNRLVLGLERSLLRLPLFRTVYSPVKQLIEAFSPDNAAGFKRVVIVVDRTGVRRLGFLTREFELSSGEGTVGLVAVFVPTNHLYIGDVYFYPPEWVVLPDLTVEEGLRIVLTGGTAVPKQLTGRPLAGVAARGAGVPEQTDIESAG
ncbi:MAG TPA: DUF502 domain-containing protein [Vicinamibacterales bacterium]|nr:DUF502 domain-containing protein [Acidobacteriota bacterium]HOC16614.1 DUF502 domain-containing protein [Vicinamibacterales bacterium]